MFRQISPYTILLALAVFLLSATLAFAIGDGQKSLLLAGGICLSPLVLLLPRCRVILPRVDLPIAIFCVFMLSALRHPETLRWGTVLFALGFCCYFMMTARLIRAARLGYDRVITLMTWLVYLYTIVLLIQQLCVLCGWPVFNYINTYRHPWKLNALATESSHVTFVLGTYMFYLGLVKRSANPSLSLWADIRSCPLLWIAYLWSLFTIYNASAFLMLPISLTAWIRRKNIAPVIAVIACAVIFITTVPLKTNSFNVDRVSRFARNIYTLDEKMITQADVSSAERIVPMLRCARLMNPAETGFWFGHGVDSDAYAVGPTILEEKPIPYLFHVWYNYGFFANMALLWLTVSICFMKERPATWIATIAAIVLLAANTSTSIWLILALALQLRVLAKPDTTILKPLGWPDTNGIENVKA